MVKIYIRSANTKKKQIDTSEPRVIVTGRTLAENVANVAELILVRPDTHRHRHRPCCCKLARSRTPSTVRARDNLAPGSTVANITGNEDVRFDVMARVIR